MQYELSVNISPGEKSGFEVVIAAIAPDQSKSYINNLNGLNSLLGIENLPSNSSEPMHFNSRSSTVKAVSALLENFDELAHLLDKDRQAGEWE